VTAGLRIRAEWFGGIVALERPRALVSVNRAMARAVGLASSPRWKGADPGHLRAPTEVHLVTSRRCEAGCRSCYVSATPRGEQMSLPQASAALEHLAAQGVFHVALGGGEATELPHLFAIAARARELGLIPNLTTNGLSMTPSLAERCRVFGQVNVSVDGVGEAYRRARGFDGFAQAKRALELLRAVKREVGINCVVSRSSYPKLHEVVALAKQLKLADVELLRFKPAGRGAAQFGDEDLTGEQARGLFPRAQWLSVRYRMRVKLDCSFAPMVFWHRPSSWVARFFGVVGCEGGNVLAAVMPDGALQGCSFGGPREGSAFDGNDVERAFADSFGSFRGFEAAAVEPCRSCAYLSLCKGGCRVVAQAQGAWADPDPGCPRVRAHGAQGS
jgi:radical SAM protein with 4Fe4S-binding SPASM domain